jgi:hypothetical protein
LKFEKLGQELQGKMQTLDVLKTSGVQEYITDLIEHGYNLGEIK